MAGRDALVSAVSDDRRVSSPVRPWTSYDRTVSIPSVFGQIRDEPIGRKYPDRAAVRAAGLHRHEQAGISGNYADGADAIVVSGGYKDDRDHGDWILYTGQGGRDSAGR